MCELGSEAVHSWLLDCHNCAVSWLFHLLTVCTQKDLCLDFWVTPFAKSFELVGLDLFESASRE